MVRARLPCCDRWPRTSSADRPASGGQYRKRYPCGEHPSWAYVARAEGLEDFRGALVVAGRREEQLFPGVDLAAGRVVEDFPGVAFQATGMAATVALQPSIH